jgi:hypothetical protein
MKRIAYFLFAMSLLIGCGGGGGGGGGGEGVTPGDLTGQYTMTGFTIATSDGQVITENDVDVGTWSGSMDIGHNTMSILLTLNGETDQIEGSYTATWTSSTEGTIFDGYDTMDFTLSGGNLTFHMGNIDMGNGITMEMWLYWHKYSDSHTSLSLGNKSVVTNDANPIGNISQFLKSLMK